MFGFLDTFIAKDITPEEMYKLSVQIESGNESQIMSAVSRLRSVCRRYSQHSHLLGYALSYAGLCHSRQKQSKKAMSELEEAVCLLKGYGSNWVLQKNLLARSYLLLAMEYYANGNSWQGRSYGKKALKLYRQLDDKEPGEYSQQIEQVQSLMNFESKHSPVGTIIVIIVVIILFLVFCH